MQPPSPSQRSLMVQLTPSLQLPRPASMGTGMQLPAGSRQVPGPRHVLLGKGQVRGTPVHAPLEQLSAMVQASPSLQLPLMAMYSQSAVVGRQKPALE